MRVLRRFVAVLLIGLLGQVLLPGRGSSCPAPHDPTCSHDRHGSQPRDGAAPSACPALACVSLGVPPVAVAYRLPPVRRVADSMHAPGVSSRSTAPDRPPPRA